MAIGIIKKDRAIHGHPIQSGSQNQFRGSCFPAVNNRSIERINVVRSLFTDTEFRGMNNRPAGRSRKLHLEFPGTDRQLAEITFPFDGVDKRRNVTFRKFFCDFECGDFAPDLVPG